MNQLKFATLATLASALGSTWMLDKMVSVADLTRCPNDASTGFEAVAFADSKPSKDTSSRRLPSLQACKPKGDDEFCFIPMSIRRPNVDDLDPIGLYDESMERNVEVLCGDYEEPLGLGL